MAKILTVLFVIAIACSISKAQDKDFQKISESKDFSLYDLSSGNNLEIYFQEIDEINSFQARLLDERVKIDGEQMQQVLEIDFNSIWYTVFVFGSVLVIAVVVIVNLLALFMQITSMQEAKYKSNLENVCHYITLAFECISFLLGIYCVVQIWRFSLSYYQLSQYMPTMDGSYDSEKETSYCFEQLGQGNACSSSSYKFNVATNQDATDKSFYYYQDEVEAEKENQFFFYPQFEVVIMILAAYIIQFKFLTITSIAGFFSIGERQNKQPLIYYDDQQLERFCSKKSCFIIPIQILTWWFEYAILGSIIFPSQVLTEQSQLSLFNHKLEEPDIEKSKFNSLCYTWFSFFIVNTIIQSCILADMIPTKKRKLFQKLQEYYKFEQLNFKELSFYWAYLSVAFHFFFNFIVFFAFLDIQKATFSYNKLFLSVGIVKSILAGFRLR